MEEYKQMSASDNLENKPGFVLSHSVQNAMKMVGFEKPVKASALVEIIFHLHPEYLGEREAFPKLEDTTLEKTAEEWVEECQALFDPEKIFEISSGNENNLNQEKQNNSVIFHGRLLVIGLCLLEPELRIQLERQKFLEELEKRLKESLVKILTPYGEELFHNKVNPSNSNNANILEEISFDSVPTWNDDPIETYEQDLLKRAAFARFLAKRIQNIPTNGGAYSIHVFGHWGAGKSSLLNMLCKEMETLKTEKSKWLVVEFNAWINQHIQPPWWTLMEQVFSTTKKKLTYWGKFQEYWWRLNTSRVSQILGGIIFIWFIAFFLFPYLSAGANEAETMSVAAKNAEDISKILALAVTIWGGVVAFNRSLLFGAAHAAKHYNELTNDPTSEIKKRFNDLISKLSPNRVIILIDDLDRCQSQFVVDLLEGIQTLFREAPVVFVVAADRHWLHACYERVYKDFQSKIHEPGKSLGELFLEKAFRFSTPMPGISDNLKEAYWQHLLNLYGEDQEKDKEEALQKAKKEVENARSEGEVQKLVQNSKFRPFLEQQAIREEAAVKLAAPELMKRLEHTLKPYSPYLEPNPRAMKLLVNSYSANRALAILSEIEVSTHQLALWTVLSSRWPSLADYLAESPEKINEIGHSDPNVKYILKSLINDPAVLQVLQDHNCTNGKDAPEPLQTETLKKCGRMRG